jgi:hypothetical protein
MDKNKCPFFLSDPISFLFFKQTIGVKLFIL